MKSIPDKYIAEVTIMVPTLLKRNTGKFSHDFDEKSTKIPVSFKFNVFGELVSYTGECAAIYDLMQTQPDLALLLAEATFGKEVSAYILAEMAYIPFRLHLCAVEDKDIYNMLYYSHFQYTYWEPVIDKMEEMRSGERGLCKIAKNIFGKDAKKLPLSIIAANRQSPWYSNYLETGMLLFPQKKHHSLTDSLQTLVDYCKRTKSQKFFMQFCALRLATETAESADSIIATALIEQKKALLHCNYLTEHCNSLTAEIKIAMKRLAVVSLQKCLTQPTMLQSDALRIHMKIIQMIVSILLKRYALHRNEDEFALVADILNTLDSMLPPICGLEESMKAKNGMRKLLIINNYINNIKPCVQKIEQLYAEKAKQMLSNPIEHYYYKWYQI